MRTRRRSVSALAAVLACLLLLGSFSGCGGSGEVRPPAQTQSTAPTSAEGVSEASGSEAPVTDAPAPFAADYALVWEALETDYPYLPYLRDKGIDVDGIRARYAAKLEQAADTEDFAALLEEMFRDLKNTAHLSLVSRDFFPMLYRGYTETSDDFHAAWRETAALAAASAYYAPTPEQEAEDPSSDSASYCPPAKYSWYEDCKTLCLSIRTFLPDTVDRDRDLLRNALEAHPDAENLVFDIAGNSGGDDRYWRQNLVGPFGEDHSLRQRLYFRGTERNLPCFEGRWDCFSTAEAEDAAPWAEALGLDRFCRVETPIPGREAVHSDAKRWVLVNEQVYSSSESFVCFCKATGWATVAGTRTGGDGVGFDPVLRFLPDSGLLFRFSIGAGENPDGTMSLEGTAPDLELPGSGISYLLEYLRAQRKAAD